MSIGPCQLLGKQDPKDQRLRRTGRADTLGTGNSCPQEPMVTQREGLNGWRDEGAGAEDVRQG